MMAGDGVTTRLQKDVFVLQQEMVKVQNELSQLDSKWDTKIEARFKGFKEEFQVEIHFLFEKYLGNTTASNTTTTIQAKGKGVLGGLPPRFLAKDNLKALPQTAGQPTPNSVRIKFLLECSYCSRFNDTDF
ncbi:hypothetical protein PVK06_047937 [Gossypium arboreum]|uniref:Uncharacterized protein n=1 Tax=Gossypium arboreum TaxID=29729 RepID=A0ABR0MEQ1_GOSAR|nr:hypothetical protein PVK06_047937 [Gossypium arboreum]